MTAFSRGSYLEAGMAGSPFTFCVYGIGEGGQRFGNPSAGPWPGLLPGASAFCGRWGRGKQGSVLFFKAWGCLGHSKRSGWCGVLSRMLRQHLSAILDYLRLGLGQGAKILGAGPHRAGATVGSSQPRPRFLRCSFTACLPQDADRQQEVESSCWRCWALFSLPLGLPFGARVCLCRRGGPGLPVVAVETLAYWWTGKRRCGQSRLIPKDWAWTSLGCWSPGPIESQRETRG